MTTSTRGALGEGFGEAAGEGDHDAHSHVYSPRAHVTRARLNPRVLVLGIIPTLTWSVVRSLAHAGIRPVVLGWHRVSPLGWVPDCTYEPLRSLRWVNGEVDPVALDQVEEACVRHRIDVVVPVDFPGTYLLSRHGARLTNARIAAVPDAETMRAFHDKFVFSGKLAELGIPQPLTELARTNEELLATCLPFPIITKPVDRWASVGFQIHDTRNVLEERVSSGGMQAELPLLVQQFIPGKDVGFGFIARHGELVAHAAFEEPRRGQRRYFEAPELREHVATLLAAIGYHGVGEIDARFDTAAREYRLLEINPRFWASHLYATRAGMNFPQMLTQLDDFVEGCGFEAETQAVRLDPYELAVGKAMQLAERIGVAWARWRGV